jgi:hypothetical protein
MVLKMDKYESPNAVYQSEGHPIFMQFCCYRILQHSEWSISQICVQHFTFSIQSLLNHNIYAVTVGEDEEFGFKQVTFN